MTSEEIESVSICFSDASNWLTQQMKQRIISNKRSGRKQGQLDKLSPELKDDIKKYLHDRSIKQVDLMKKHDISRNTLKKYIKAVNEN